MQISCRATLAAIVSCYPATGVMAQTQQQATRFDLTHCWVASTTVIERAPAFRAQSLPQQGVTRANEPGGQFDNFATRCLGTIASIDGAPPEGRGFCEWAGTGEDRVFIRWTLEAGRGSGAFVGGTGRYRGISGEISFRPIAPIPTLEPGVIRTCLHNTGEFRLP